ncbi:hypothetical protein J6590_061890 [Homalodisca vitripennis]|nr:hypothetical protein J6590_061890 [Homalodisca vitripennis]
MGISFLCLCDRFAKAAAATNIFRCFRYVVILYGERQKCVFVNNDCERQILSDVSGPARRGDRGSGSSGDPLSNPHQGQSSRCPTTLVKLIPNIWELIYPRMQGDAHALSSPRAFVAFVALPRVTRQRSFHGIAIPLSPADIFNLLLAHFMEL